MPQQHILNEQIDAIRKKIPSINIEWELYFLRKSTYSVEGNDLEIDKKKEAIKDLYVVRVINDKRAGTASCSVLDNIPYAFDSALKISQVSEPDEFISIPEPSQLVEIPVFDQKVIEKKESLPEILLNFQRAAIFDNRIKKIRNAEIHISIDFKGIINSKGISIFQPFTTIIAQIIAVAESSEPQMAWAYKAERFFKNINFEEVGREAAMKAIKLLNPKRIKSFKGYAVLDPYVAGEFIELISQSISAENYQMGKSIFTDKLGQLVTNSKLYIIDNGIIPERFGSAPFDAEGVPTREKTLVENGILKQLMHNTYTANRHNTYSTGNAIRTDRGISVGPTNLYIEWEGIKLSKEEIISIVDRGIYITELMGIHTANPITGDFSVGVSGLYIEKGELKHAIKESVISGNVLELFKRIVAFGKDLTFYGNIGAPTLLVEGIDISG